MLLAVGLQYYHIAKIVLAMSLPIARDSVFEQIRESKKVEVSFQLPPILQWGLIELI